MKKDLSDQPHIPSASRRTFLKSTAVVGGLSVFPGTLQALAGSAGKGIPERFTGSSAASYADGKSIIGSYGPWAEGLAGDPPVLSFRNGNWPDLESWREAAMDRALELVAVPGGVPTPEVEVHLRSTWGGLEIEQLSWQLPYGRRTRAIFLKPAGAKGPLPGILGLHDHGGNKYFGRRKITRTGQEMHPMMQEHQKEYYEDRAWANELAQRGYAVLVHDAFAFASRRVMLEDMTEIRRSEYDTRGLSDADPEKEVNIRAYNSWASAHEHIMAKSLFCAGTTWPGVFLGEDRAALNVLSNRPDVDPGRLGCAGLSGGGLRTVFLGGLDHRIKCAAAVGFMSTWSDFLLNKSYTHTWMTYVPLLPKYLDFPEILGLRVPLPTMTLNNNQDALFTLEEMKRANGILQEVFDRAGAGDRYRGGFYEGPHKFDAKMQEDAFDWFDQWLGQMDHGDN